MEGGYEPTVVSQLSHSKLYVNIAKMSLQQFSHFEENQLLVFVVFSRGSLKTGLVSSRQPLRIRFMLETECSGATGRSSAVRSRAR